MSVLAEDQAAAAGPPPEGKLEMFGDIGDFVPGVIDDPVHDPTLFEHRNVYYVFSTGIFNPDALG
jgi:arabinan endo-1,5-alpha-L-arabinosidase